MTAGFTLTEVIVGMAIGVVILALTGEVWQCLVDDRRAVGVPRAAEFARAVSLLEQDLAERVAFADDVREHAGAVDIELGTAQHRFTRAGETWIWSRSTQRRWEVLMRGLRFDRTEPLASRFVELEMSSDREWLLAPREIDRSLARVWWQAPVDRDVSPRPAEILERLGELLRVEARPIGWESGAALLELDEPRLGIRLSLGPIERDF